VQLGDDEIFTAVEELDATLAAARAALETLAASHLSFAAQLRVHKASTERARAWFAENAGEAMASWRRPLAGLVGGRPDETDEILRHTLGSASIPIDVGPEGGDATDGLLSADGLGVEGLNLSADLDDDLVDVDSLVQFTDEDEIIATTAETTDESDEEPDLVEVEVELEEAGDEAEDDGLVEASDALVEFEELDAESGLVDDDEDFVDSEEDDSARYVVYEESGEEPEEVLIGLDEADSMGDDPLLSGDDFGGVAEESPGDPDSGADMSQLVDFTEADDLVTLGGEDDSFALEEDVPSIEPEEDDDLPREDTEDVTGDSTLVADLESLVRLKDMIAEDDGSGAAHGGEREVHRPEPRATDPVRVTTTLTDDDLNQLGFASTDQLVAPEGADADPHSETDSRPAIRVGTPEPASHTKAPARGDDDGQSYGAPGSAEVDLGALPTIRDQQPGSSRPSAAAIRIDPSGGGRAVMAPPEEEALALGGAPDDEDDEVEDDFGDGGLSLAVEEYEVVEDEEDEVADLLGAKDDATPPPAPMPTLSADQQTALLRQADAAYDRGELPVAADLYSDLLDFNPDNGRAALGRGRVYLDLGDYARAMSDFTVAEDILADEPDVHAAIGELYYARKDYQRAIDYFDEALKLNDRHAMAWCRRGIAHYYRKDYDQAYQDLVKAQKLDDSIPNIRTYIGMVKKKRK